MTTGGEVRSDEFSWLNGLFAGVYTAECRFSHLPSFIAGLRSTVDEARPENPVELVRVVREYGRTQSDANSPLARLVGRDVLRIADSLERLDSDHTPNSEFQIRESLKDASVRAAGLLSTSGLAIEAPDVYVVEEFPSPYSKSPAAVLAADEGDRSDYGISPGVYFRRANLRPFYSVFLYLHELFHVALGKVSPHQPAHGLEEGIADLLGSIWLSHHVLGEDLTRRLFILNRLSSGYDPHWERYLDSARRAFGVVLTQGFDRVLAICRDGRTEILVEERDVWSSHPLQEISAPAALVGLATDLLLMYPRAFVVSPAAFVVAETSLSGDSVGEVAARARLPLDDARTALRELRDSLGAVVLRKDEAVVREAVAANVLASGWLRYRTGPQ